MADVGQAKLMQTLPVALSTLKNSEVQLAAVARLPKATPVMFTMFLSNVKPN